MGMHKRRTEGDSKTWKEECHITFTSDHTETLYELHLEYAKESEGVLLTHLIFQSHLLTNFNSLGWRSTVQSR